MSSAIDVFAASSCGYLSVFISTLWLLVISVICLLHLGLIRMFQETETLASLLQLRHPLPIIIDINKVANQAVSHYYSSYVEISQNDIHMDSWENYSKRVKIILWSACILLTLIIHESGHYYYARRFGVTVEGLAFKFWSGSLAIKVNREEMKKASNMALTCIHAGGLVFNLFQMAFFTCISAIFHTIRAEFTVALSQMILICGTAMLFVNSLPIKGLDGYALTKLLLGLEPAAFCSKACIILFLFSYIIYPISLESQKIQ